MNNKNKRTTTSHYCRPLRIRSLCYCQAGCNVVGAFYNRWSFKNSRIKFEDEITSTRASNDRYSSPGIAAYFKFVSFFPDSHVAPVDILEIIMRSAFQFFSPFNYENKIELMLRMTWWAGKYEVGTRDPRLNWWPSTASRTANKWRPSQ